jgi:hypothetical protein
MGFDASAVDFDRRMSKLPKISFGHLRTATVAGTQNQYFHKLGCYMHRMMNSLSQNLNQQPNQIN